MTPVLPPQRAIQPSEGGFEHDPYGHRPKPFPRSPLGPAAPASGHRIRGGISLCLGGAAAAAPADENDAESKQPDIAEQTGQSGAESAAASGDERDVVYDPNRDLVYLPKAKDRLFGKLDTNDDAAISKQEAQAYQPLAEEFQRIDTYANERITRSEFALFEVQEDAAMQDGQPRIPTQPLEHPFRVKEDASTRNGQPQASESGGGGRGQ